MTTVQLLNAVARTIQMIVSSWPKVPQTQENWQPALEWGLDLDSLQV